MAQRISMCLLTLHYFMKSFMYFKLYLCSEYKNILKFKMNLIYRLFGNIFKKNDKTYRHRLKE